MYTNDTRYGSTSDRYHIFGIPPYNVYGRVPALSHYLNDMVPYYLCCEWTDLCDSYLFVRETAECKGYRYPKSAAIYGDPHVMTFDGKDYSFNARGEFRLLISTRHNFILQGRFERPPNASCKFKVLFLNIKLKSLTKFSFFLSLRRDNKRPNKRNSFDGHSSSRGL